METTYKIVKIKNSNVTSFKGMTPNNGFAKFGTIEYGVKYNTVAEALKDIVNFNLINAEVAEVNVITNEILDII
jgi:hypothetical protein